MQMGSVRKKGNKWYYSIELPPINGKRRRIERAGGNTEEEALEALYYAESDYEKYGYLRSEKNILFADYLDYWFKQYVEMNCSYNTQKLYALHIKKHLKPILGLYNLREISPLILQEFINQKKKEGLSKNTLENLRRVLTGCLKYAIFPAELIKENPAQYIKVPLMRTNKKNHVLPIEDFNRMSEFLSASPVKYTIFQTGWHTGMRSGEICALQWSDIDFDERTIYVRHNAIKKDGEVKLRNLKTESSHRDIAVSEILLDHLRKWRTVQDSMVANYNRKKYKRNNFVFTKKSGAPFYNQDISKISSEIRKELEIDFNFHMLRHTHATMLLEAGANIKDIQNRLGHANISITMDIYASTTQNMKNDTVKKFEQLISR